MYVCMYVCIIQISLYHYIDDVGFCMSVINLLSVSVWDKVFHFLCLSLYIISHIIQAILSVTHVYVKPCNDPLGLLVKKPLNIQCVSP